MKRTCNQCYSDMPYAAEVSVPDCTIEAVNISVCTNPACPNFGLLQISAEQMPKEDEPEGGKK